MGFGDFLSGVKDAAVNVGKGAAYAADVTHWDDIAGGVGDAAKYVAKNPGKTWDVGFEVGRAIAKDQVDPVNLAINAGLLAATVATGGAAAPAFIAKLGMGVKSAEVGISALKGASTASSVAKGVKFADTALDAAKTVDKVGDVAKALKTTEKVVETVDKVDKVADTGKALSRTDKFLEQTGTLGRVTDPIATRAGAGSMRTKAAQKLLDVGGDAGLARQTTAALIQGTGRRAPTQLVGMSDKAHDIQMAAWRGKRIKDMTYGAEQKAESVAAGVEVAADPAGAVREQAIKEADRRGVGKSSGYTAENESLWEANQLGTDDQDLWEANKEDGVAGKKAEKKAAKKEAKGRGAWAPSGPHSWEGPRSQALGGISSSYDWRGVDPLRPISAPSVKQAGRYSAYKKGLQEQRANGVVETPAAPLSAAPATRPASSFSPETPKFALTAGARPIAAIGPAKFPALGSGPKVHFGPEAGRAPGEYNATSEPGDVVPSRYRDVIETTATDTSDTPSSWTEAELRAGIGTAAPMYSNNTTRTQRRPAGINPVALPVLKRDRNSNFPIA